jgi:hypothetical protein
MLGLPRLLIVYAIAVPLALVLGMLLATPDIMSLMMIGSVLFVLSLPILIKWHHLILIIFWNAAFNVFFLPGQPHFWLGLAVLSFGFSWLNGILGRKSFLRVPELTKPVLFLAAVVALTALYRRGVGIRALGGSLYGGRNYVYVAAAIIGYFALTAEQIPVRQAGKVAAAYFLSGITFVLSNVVFALGPSFYFLFFLLPAEYAVSQAMAQTSADPHTAERLSGLAPAALAVICYIFLRWGVRGIFTVTRPWRFVLFSVAVIVGSYGGYRSLLIMFVLLFFCQFFFEGLLRTRYLLVVSFLLAVALVGIVFFADRLPMQLQRSLSIWPGLKVDPSVRADAIGSTEWRLDMWKALLPDIPKYLVMGKGYAIDPTDLFLAQDAAYRGLDSSYAIAKVAGDYHNGPLSVIVPFGLWGAIGFVWLLWAGTKVLYLNYRYGNPALRQVNTFLLTYFVAKAILFILVFGAFNAELCVFTGLLGLGVSLNGGVARQAVPARPRPALALAVQPA